MPCVGASEAAGGAHAGARAVLPLQEVVALVDAKHCAGSGGCNGQSLGRGAARVRKLWACLDESKPTIASSCRRWQMQRAGAGPSCWARARRRMRGCALASCGSCWRCAARSRARAKRLARGRWWACAPRSRCGTAGALSLWAGPWGGFSGPGCRSGHTFQCRHVCHP